MEAIQNFNHPQLGNIRAFVSKNNEPWFVGKDVATILGYKNSRDALSKHVEDEDKTTVVICDTGSNYKSQAVLINESGLYSLILASKLPQAREFKHWVTAEVLPQIRKTGGYIPLWSEEGRGKSEEGRGKSEESISDSDIIARALAIAQRTIQLRNQLLEAQRKEMKFAQAEIQRGGCVK